MMFSKFKIISVAMFVLLIFSSNTTSNEGLNDNAPTEIEKKEDTANTEIESEDTIFDELMELLGLSISSVNCTTACCSRICGGGKIR